MVSTSARPAGLRPPPEWPVWREYAQQTLVLVAVLVLLFPGVFLRGERISPGDILFAVPPWSHYAPPGWERPQNKLMSDVLTAFVPYHYLTEQAIENNEWPLWNPLELTGAPLLANYQSAVFYPPRLISSLFNIHVAMTLLVLLKLWLCGLTAYACARALKLGIPGARFFSLAWMLGSYNVLWCCWPIANVSAWFPVIFLGTEWLLEGRYRRGFCALAAGASLGLLGGHPESLFALNLGLALYFFLRLAWDRRWGRSFYGPVLVLGAAWCVAALVSAAQLFPFIEYLRNGTEMIANAGPRPGFPAGAAACFWIPRFFGTSADMNYWGSIDSNRFSMIYAGMAVWAGAVLLLNKRSKGDQHTARAVCLAITCAFLVAFAFEVPPLGLLHRLPVLSLMKRTYHVAFVMFSLPLLAAIGLERWFARPRRLRECAGWLAAAVGIALVVGYIYYFNLGLIRALKIQDYVQHQLAVGAGLGLLCLALLCASCMSYRPRLYQALFLGVLVADLLAANYRINPTLPKSSLYPATQLTEFLQQIPKPCRIGLREGLIPAGLMTPYGIEDFAGYDGLYPERIMRFQQELGPDIWSAMEPVCGIAYYLHEPALSRPQFPLDDRDRFEFVAKYDGLEIYRNKRALDRAFLVGEARIVPNRAALFEAMKSPAFDPRRVVLLERDPGGPLPRCTSADPGSANVVHRSGSRVVVEADVACDAVLVLSDAYYPGWKASVDGRPAAIFPTYYAFRGVMVPAGKHRIEFRYAPSSFYAGLAVSVATLITSVILSLFWLSRRRHRNAGILPAGQSRQDAGVTERER